MFEEKIQNALWVIDVATGKKKAQTPEQWLQVILYSTKILRLYEIDEKLNGWSRYIYDKSNATLGKDAKIKLMELRKEALNKILSYPEEEIKSIKNFMKEEFIASKIMDYEPSVRPNFYKLLNIFLNDRSLTHYKLALATPIPINVIISDIGYMLVTVDSFKLPVETLKEFESENDANSFFANFLMLILYAKQKRLFEPETIINDKFASKYVKECYKIFSKSIKDEKKLSIGELIRNGNIWDAVAELQMIENFYIAFKNMYNIHLVSFGYGELKISSFVCDAIYSVDKYGLEKMAEAFEKNKNSTKEYFTAICYLNAILQEYIIDKRVYLSRELEPVMPENAIFALPVKITAECTADWKKIKNLGDVPCSLFGIKNIRIDTMDNKFINIRKAPEDFEFEPVYATIAKAEVYSEPQKEEYMRGGVMFMPEFLVLLSSLMINRKIDEKSVEIANSNPVLRKFSYVTENGKSGIVGYFTNYIVEETKNKRSKK